MQKFIASILSAAMLLMMTGCTNKNSGELQTTSELPIESAENPVEPSETPIEAAEVPAADTPPVSALEQRLGNAVKDAYTGIEIDAFIRERKAILPGFAVPITVTVKNTGDETIDYVKGSGSYTIPDSLFISIDELQPVLPTDRLGVATMDFRTGELKPGEQLEFVFHVMTIEPNAEFDKYTIEMYGRDGEYIAEKGWVDLQDELPDLKPIEAGSYHGKVYFLYHTRSEGVTNFTTAPDGYAEGNFTISVG